MSPPRPRKRKSSASDFRCGAEREVGALYVYRSAGIVVRCPDCDLVLMRIVEAPDRMWVDFSGLSTVQISS